MPSGLVPHVVRLVPANSVNSSTGVTEILPEESALKIMSPRADRLFNCTALSLILIFVEGVHALCMGFPIAG